MKVRSRLSEQRSPSSTCTQNLQRWRLCVLISFILAATFTPSITYAQEKAPPETSSKKAEEPSLENSSKSSSDTEPEGEGKEANLDEAFEDATPEVKNRKVALEQFFSSTIPTPKDASPEEAAEYEAYKLSSQRFLNEVRAYQKEIEAVVLAEYKRKISHIEKTYKVQIDEARTDERSNRNDTLRRLEAFIAKHPNNATFTPGILYRLAVLHYEKDDDEFYAGKDLSADFPDFSASVGYSQRLVDEYPAFPQLDGARYLLGFCFKEMEKEEASRDAFMGLITNHPDSRKTPEALTRLGEFYFDSSQNIVSGYSTGEVQWAKARGYYQQAVDYGPEYAIYDRALYRVAWADYYMEDYPSMIAVFKTLVEFADESPKGSSLRKEAIEFMANVLAEEDWNLQDDISTDPNFGMARFNEFLDNKKEYETEVLREYAEVLASKALYPKAAEAYAALLERAPCNPDNPKIHEDYIGVLNLGDQKRKAIEVQAQLDNYYGKGSEWYKCQEREGNFIAIGYANSLAREALSNSFKNYYIRANDLAEKSEGLRWIGNQPKLASRRDGLEELMKTAGVDESEYALGLFLQDAACSEEQGISTTFDARADCVSEQSLKTFKLSADTVTLFLEKYPNGANLYIYRYILADSLALSNQHLRASEEFEKVRDIVDGRHRRDAAIGAIESHSLLALEGVKSGSLQPGVLSPDLMIKLAVENGQDLSDYPNYIISGLEKDHSEELSKKQQKTLQNRISAMQKADKVSAETGQCSVKPIEVPAQTQKLVDSREKYILYNLDSRLAEGDPPAAATYTYLNALIFFNHNQTEEAQKRFEDFFLKYGKNEYSDTVSQLYAESFRRVCDEPGMAKAADLIAKGDFASAETQKGLATALTGNLFFRANRLFKKGSLAKQAGDTSAATKYFSAAAEEFEEIVNKNPDYENIHLALYNAGVANEEIKRYESAMRIYNRIYTEYNEKEEAIDALYRVAFNGERFFNFDLAVRKYLELHASDRKHPSKNKALKQAGIILKYTEKYERSAEIFRKYHDTYPEQPDAPELLFESALMYQEMGSYPKMANTLEYFRKNYNDDPKFLAIILESYNKQGDHMRKKGDERKARSFYEKTLRKYQASGAQSGAPAFQAAQAQFMLSDMAYEKWALIKPGKKIKDFLSGIDQKIEQEKVVAEYFNQVLSYKNATWSMAAVFRIGSMKHNFSKVLADADCPPSLDLDSCDGILEGLAEQSEAFENQAKSFYQQVTLLGEKQDLVNEWTRLALNGLNDIAPKEYPIFDGERTAHRHISISPQSLLTPSYLDKDEAPDDIDDSLDDALDDEPGDDSIDGGLGDEEKIAPPSNSASNPSTTPPDEDEEPDDGF